MAEAHQLFSLSSDEKRLKHDNNSQSCSAWIHSDSGFFFFNFILIISNPDVGTFVSLPFNSEAPNGSEINF